MSELKMPEGVHDLISRRVAEENYEVDPLRLVNEHVKPWHRVLEGGAGLGYITRRLSELATVVVACEANAELFHCADENAPEAIVLHRILWGKPISRHVEEAHTGDGFGVGEVSEAIPIEPDTLIAGFRLNALVLDIEGEETNVIRYMKTLPELDLVIVEWHPERTGVLPMTKAHSRLMGSGFKEVECVRDGGVIHSCYVMRFS